jgi:hypothetical protein
MTSRRWLAGRRRRIRCTTRLRLLGGRRQRTRGMTSLRWPGGPRRQMTRGMGGPRRTTGMARLRSLDGRRRTPGTAGLQWRTRDLSSPRPLGGLPTIPGLAGRPRMIQGSGSSRWLAGQRPSTQASACPRPPIAVLAAPPLPGRVQVAAAVRVTSGRLGAAVTAAGIVVPETRALLAARRPGLRPARLAQGRHPLAWPAAAPLPREKPRVRRLSRLRNVSLLARPSRLRNASLTARLSRPGAPKGRAVGCRRGCSRWPVPRPLWPELSPSS